MTAMLLAMILHTVPACEYEDGSSQAICGWDAGSAGNGVGESFISLDYGTTTVYL